MAWDQNAASWTAAELLSDVRRVASLPLTSTDFTDAVLLREASDVLWSFAGWAMQQAGEGRLADVLERPVTGLLSSSYRAQSELELPPLAIADTVSSVTWRTADGAGEARLQRLDHAVESDYDRPGSEGTPSAYALVGGRLRLYPRPNAGGTVRVVYQRRHPHLVLDQPAVVGTVAALGTTTPATVALTLSGTAPTLAAGDRVDLLSGQSPYRALVTHVPVATLVSLTLTLTLAPALVTGLDLGGVRVVKTGTSPYVHYPLELRASVTEKVAANVMRRVGDLTNAQASEQTAREELVRVMQMLSPRTKRDRPKVVNPYSHLRLGMHRLWRPR